MTDADLARWETWVRDDLEHGSAPRPPIGHDEVLALIAEVRRLRAMQTYPLFSVDSDTGAITQVD